MDVRGEPAAERAKGRAWLETLTGQSAREAAAALADLPTDAGTAGAALPQVIAAWTVADPETAARLIEAWLATMDAEGNLTPAVPVVCQWVERLAEALSEPEPFLARILPALAKCVEREFDRYDVRGTGLPLWPAAEEALFPAEFAPGRFTVDLAVLLSNEAAAFCRLAEGHPEFNRSVGVAEGVQRELDDWLQENFWDEEAGAFLRHDAGAESLPDDSPCGWIPLAWGRRTDEMVESLRPRAAQADYADWPARARILFFTLLLRTPHNSVLEQMRCGRLAADAGPVERAAWAVLAAGADGARGPFRRNISRPARWLDAHGRAIAFSLAGVVGVLMLGLLVRGLLQREKPSAGDGVELERQARGACAEGRHDRAAALYRQAAQQGHAAYFRYRQAGEWMHLGHFAEAETAYRALLAEAHASPNARLNLALAVLRQGRREEARDLYRAFAEEPGADAHPELAARARLAAELIDRQLALDRDGP